MIFASLPLLPYALPMILGTWAVAAALAATIPVPYSEAAGFAWLSFVLLLGCSGSIVAVCL